MKSTIFFFLLIIIVSCGNSDDNIKEVKLDSEVKDCLQFEKEKRKVIATFSNVKGNIVSPGDKGCSNLYTIKGGPMVEGRFMEYLWACNMPDNLKKGDVNIVFSGDLYETFDTENICAQSFLLTKINLE